jgi:hypothetical protein
VPKKNAFLFSATFSAFGMVILAGPAFAEGCLARPGSNAPQGRHWYYTLDRNTHRKCWILGSEGLKPRSRENLSDDAVPPRKPQMAFTSALNNVEVPAPVKVKPADSPSESPPPSQATAEKIYSTAGVSTRLPDVSTAAGLTGSEGGPASTDVTEEVASPLQERLQATQATFTGTDIGASLTVGEDNVPAKDRTPLRTVLILLAGTLLASGVARLAFKLSDRPPF